MLSNKSPNSRYFCFVFWSTKFSSYGSCLEVRIEIWVQPLWVPVSSLKKKEMGKKVLWDIPPLDPVTWISITGPNQGEITGFLGRWKGFQSINLVAKVLIHVGNYSFHHELQAWSQVADAIITLSVSWAHVAHPQYQHLWSWSGIFFVVLPVPKHLSSSALST